MMMGGMGYGLIWAAILATALLLGYAYIIWILADKAAGGWKLTGQILAFVIAAIAVIMFIYSGIYAPTAMKGMASGNCGMMGAGMMEKKMMMEKMGKMGKQMPRTMMKKITEEEKKNK